MDLGRSRYSLTTDSVTSFALSSLSQERDGVNAVLFSTANIEYLQAEMARRVKAESGHSISRQDDPSLLIIMRRIYADNALNDVGNERAQVDALNEKILKVCVPMIVSGIHARLTYLRDISTLPMPLDRSSNQSSAGTRMGTFNPGM